MPCEVFFFLITFDFFSSFCFRSEISFYVFIFRCRCCTEYYKECEKILAEDAANVYIQDLPSFVALNKKYGGYEFYPLYVQDFAKLYIVDEQTE